MRLERPNQDEERETRKGGREGFKGNLGRKNRGSTKKYWHRERHNVID